MGEGLSRQRMSHPHEGGSPGGDSSLQRKEMNMERPNISTEAILKWEKKQYHEEAYIGRSFDDGDGVRFSIQHYPTCYRRGPWKLMVEVASGPDHLKWGCFDDQDQPVRYYHHEASARTEAEAIAAVLLADRAKKA
jgi:hypothetical protein